MNGSRAFLISLVILLLTAVMPAGIVSGQPSPPTYTVQPGDTLLGIAQRFGVPVEQLARVNGIEDPDLIQVGQQLVLPAAGKGSPTPKAGRSPARLIWTAAVWGAPRVLAQTLGLVDVTQLTSTLPPILNRDTTPAPLPFLAVDAPAAIVQGETGVVRVALAAPIPPMGTFQGRGLLFMGEGRDAAGFHYVALVPTAALDKPGEKPLTVRVGDVSWEESVAVRPGQYETQHIVLPPSKGGLLDPAKLKDERTRLYAIWKRVTGPPRWDGPFRFPIGEGFQRTSPYGTRRSYNGGPVASFHAGTDWGAPEGTPILAPAAGVIVLAEDLAVRGGAVIIDHGAGVYSNFWHMSQIDVKPGDVVQAGDRLGLVGTTGLSTGAHLHWEIRVNGVAVDPMQWTEQTLP